MNLSLTKIDGDFSKVKPYSLGQSIVTPDCRFVHDQGDYMFYHHRTVPNTDGFMKYGKVLPFITLGCDRMDEGGFCRGHREWTKGVPITRDMFVFYYCDGMEPQEIEYK